MKHSIYTIRILLLFGIGLFLMSNSSCPSCREDLYYLGESEESYRIYFISDSSMARTTDIFDTLFVSQGASRLVRMDTFANYKASFFDSNSFTLLFEHPPQPISISFIKNGKVDSLQINYNTDFSFTEQCGYLYRAKDIEPFQTSFDSIMIDDNSTIIFLQ